VQESITRDIKHCKTLGGGVPDHQREIIHHELIRRKEDKFVFAVGVLHGIGQRVSRRQRKPILTLTQSMVSLRPGSGSPRLMASLRRVLSQSRALRMSIELFTVGAKRIVAKFFGRRFCHWNYRHHERTDPRNTPSSDKGRN
jgi:hypothetical protein